MRLLYQHIIRNISKKDCQIIIDNLKSRVATGYNVSYGLSRGKALKNDRLYKFLTTSRPVEYLVQGVEESICKMGREKTPLNLWIVTGGYGAGKSHMKEYLRRNEIDNIKFLEPKIALLLPSDEKSAPVDVFSLILLQTRPWIDTLYGIIKKEQQFPSDGEMDDTIIKTLRDYSIDDDFINAFCAYAGSGKANQSNFHSLEDLIIKKGEQLFLPLMKLYKKYLGVNGLCIFIDEFERLQLLPQDRRMRFVESIRAFYDTIASTNANHDLPSFMMIILCTLSFWNELTSDTRSQALETRVRLFEIPPLVDDEIISLAEKIYVLHKKSGYPAPKIYLKFNKLPAYLVQRAGIEAPLTPRFVINEIITIIEEPNDYLKFGSQT